MRSNEVRKSGGSTRPDIAALKNGSKPANENAVEPQRFMPSAQIEAGMEIGLVKVLAPTDDYSGHQRLWLVECLSCHATRTMTKDRIRHGAICKRCSVRDRVGRPQPHKRRTMEDKFWSKVLKRGADECWHWTGAKSGAGYGVVRSPRTFAHRVSYELNVGPIPVGLVIDHLCMNKLCVNPKHLEPVTASENTKRWWRSQTRLAEGSDK